MGDGGGSIPDFSFLPKLTFPLRQLAEMSPKRLFLKNTAWTHTVLYVKCTTRKKLASFLDYQFALIFKGEFFPAFFREGGRDTCEIKRNKRLTYFL